MGNLSNFETHVSVTAGMRLRQGIACLGKLGRTPRLNAGASSLLLIPFVFASARDREIAENGKRRSICNESGSLKNPSRVDCERAGDSPRCGRTLGLTLRLQL